jgi:hypothetical protein
MTLDEAKKAVAEGKQPWEGQDKDARISVRVEPLLKELLEDSLPKYASISDIIREHVIGLVESDTSDL